MMQLAQKTFRYPKKEAVMDLLRILLAILVPPVGVFLTVGISTAFVINILLTLLGWFPGSIHAVWVLSKHSERVGERESGY
jgi:uncharacterized membrane protein YqaE (UPF0057 family)